MFVQGSSNETRLGDKFEKNDGTDGENHKDGERERAHECTSTLSSPLLLSFWSSYVVVIVIVVIIVVVMEPRIAFSIHVVHCGVAIAIGVCRVRYGTALHCTPPLRSSLTGDLLYKYTSIRDETETTRHDNKLYRSIPSYSTVL